MRISNFKFQISKPPLIPSFVTLIAVLSFGVRLLPHMPNFTPVGALALFVGAYAGKKYWMGFFAPLLVMFLSDLFIGFYDFRLLAVVYASFFVYSFLGFFAKKNFAAAFLSSIAGATIFYISTNFAVWLLSSELMYPHTLGGLFLSYALALPFFKYMLLGDVVFTGIFFGAYEFARAYLFRLQEQKQAA